MINTYNGKPLQLKNQDYSQHADGFFTRRPLLLLGAHFI